MVEFKVKEHTYKDVNRRYTSVTTVIKKYKAPFDEKRISESYSLKHPEKTAAEWRDVWKKNRDEAAEYGTKIHAEEEAKIKAKETYKQASVQIDDDTIRSLDEIRGLPNGVYPELLVWSNVHTIAGQIDKVTIKNNVVAIDDYKTFKKVDLKSFFNGKTREWKMMKEPLHGIQDCNFNHAALQICTYALILEELGYRIGKLRMIHITREGERIPYSVPYSKYKPFVNFMLLHYKKH